MRPRAVRLSLLAPHIKVGPEHINMIISALTGLTATEMTPQPWRDRTVCDTPLTLTTSMQDVPGASITLPYASQYLVLCFWELTVTGGYGSGQLLVDTTAADPPAGLSATASSILTGGDPGESVSTTVTVTAVVGNAYIVTTTQPDLVAKLQASRTSATSGFCGTQSSIVAVHLGPAGIGASLKGATEDTGLFDETLYLKRDGSRALTGNMAANPGVTFDGVDVSAHAGAADAHHAKSHAHNGSDGSGTVSYNNLTDKPTIPTASSILQTIYPVGSLYISTLSTNPATLLGFGTWAAFAAGRTLVGIDTGQTEFDTVEETGGAKTHTLTTGEMPQHNHSLAYPSGYDNTFLLRAGGSGGIYAQPAAGAWGGYGSQTIGNAGSGSAHNNLPPYIVVYMWKRTA